MFVLACVLSVTTHAQRSSKSAVQKPDAKVKAPVSAAKTFSCLAYHFEAGDSLMYSAEAIDTIQFVGAPWLIKKRQEKWSVVCDFTDQSGRMYIRTALLSARLKELQEGDSNEVVHNGSPWIGRMNFLILDSNGRRVLAKQPDTIHAALCPGGAFSPPILLDLFDTTCHSKNRDGWNISSEDSLAENGYPCPRIKQLFSCKIVDTTVDNAPCASIQFGQTGQASHTLVTKDVGVYTRCVVNSWGQSLLSRADNKPLFVRCSQDIKLYVSTEHDERRGEQRSVTEYKRIYSGKVRRR